MFAVLIMGSCAEQETKKGILTLHENYGQIQDIISIADCNSPFGTYTTEVHSLSDGSCYFIQKFNEAETAFRVRVDSTHQGYLISENNSVIDTLSQEDVEMIRGHEIHKMSIDPNHFYSKLQFKSKVIHQEKDHELYTGEDRLGNPVRLLYSSAEKLISKIESRNPKDTTQTIELFYDTWLQSKYGAMVKEIHIVQAKKDTFFFTFKSVEIRGESGNTKVI
ncbi:hypothetical protein [Muricauda sp. MAR_2010_75]|uniref:hypothetical protein n=1 Tax=Allomuricauda sp. MAR_2010_75 TaxID=1250232 RepID=UPI0012E03AB0|nr:hypothetical protein [Muricauda sp. MAR_2010_75]